MNLLIYMSVCLSACPFSRQVCLQITESIQTKFVFFLYIFLDMNMFVY